ncbi:MAG: hypothetical protein ACRDEA_14945 [Microcystaceae cyanobacterium]
MPSPDHKRITQLIFQLSLNSDRSSIKTFELIALQMLGVLPFVILLVKQRIVHSCELAVVHPQTTITLEKPDYPEPTSILRLLAFGAGSALKKKKA